ncbi:TPA: hypothetical protein PXE20_002489 [Mannheimia haemolytica]|nr:hypothetical protein [Mannheimia varigena]HDL5280411.1 hypothetical protein [Mannheimia haemolytica]HDL5625874.1 hypothetical protein [Mannheimia haemolytica]HDL5844698.1 hypothetical protein [Mannheimia haemolytica]HDV7267867.1 hypothetical protein [Mannheimia haemolytica]
MIKYVTNSKDSRENLISKFLYFFDLLAELSLGENKNNSPIVVKTINTTPDKIENVLAIRFIASVFLIIVSVNK